MRADDIIVVVLQRFLHRFADSLESRKVNHRLA